MPSAQNGLLQEGQSEGTGPESLGATHYLAHCAQSGRLVDEQRELILGLTRRKKIVKVFLDVCSDFLVCSNNS